MDNEKPATKQDIEMLRSEMQHMFDNLLERMADTETRLLQAFYGFADSISKRVLQREMNDALYLARFGTIESRLLEVEKRLHMPPTI
jgi:hypothetical protein